MRHPTSGLSEDDLSRLTGSSLTTSSSTTPTHENSNNNGTNGNCAIIPNINDQHHLHHHNHHLSQHHNNHNNHQHHHHHNNDNDSEINFKNKHNNFINSTYLPEIIDPLEWQKSRKRKERQDSTSSSTQDRKLVRSNSEELISNADCEVIRRVSSHEDFKKPLQEINDDNILKTIEEVCNQNENEQISNNQYKDIISSVSFSSYQETSPARSYRYSPNREYRINNSYNIANNNNNNGKSSKENNYDDYYEYEHEKRRSSERSCKSRANYPGRKAGIAKKSSKQYTMTRYHPTAVGIADENAYKYDISSMKYERRGFVSKVKLEERNRKEEAADGEQISAIDYNDNNLIDFHMHENYKNSIGSSSQKLQQHKQLFSSYSQQKKQQYQQSQHKQTIAEALPWDSTISQEEDHTPVLCRRFESIDDSTSVTTMTNDDETINNTINKTKLIDTNNINSTTNNYPLPAVVVDNEPIKSFRTFTKMENLKTREIMLQQNIIPPQGIFQQPEERLKHVNKKLQALKKRVVQLEESYEKTYGYRPSQVEKFNDKQIKSVLAEIGKLRKEKHELKSDPMTALGLKVNGGMDAEKRLIKMKETLAEIKKKLIEKRDESNRSENLDDLNADQLMHEKAAIQHSLLYFESLYGRPSTKEERDAARPLYDRYRIIKRMVSRSISVSGIGGTSELPTILEHEAMAFNVDSANTAIQHHQQQYEKLDSNTILSPDNENKTSSSSPSSSSQSSTDYVPILSSKNILANTMQMSSSLNNIDSPNDNSGSADSESSNTQNNPISNENITTQQQQQQQQKSTGILVENIHTLSLDELWELLEKARDEKKQLKRTITEFEILFEEQSGRKMLKSDRKAIDDTYTQYKQKKAKVRLLQALIKKHISK